jgi:catechol 2,3-dioxygenase-like lactoylglutathione lyase family enzyme
MAGVITEFEPALVPELLVSDVGTSLEFWCTICGFEVRYARPDEGFAYITRGSAHVMLEQSGVDRDWITAELQAPRGRGINFQITVPDVGQVLGRGVYSRPRDLRVWAVMVKDGAGRRSRSSHRGAT